MSGTRMRHKNSNSTDSAFCQPIPWLCPEIPINLRWDSSRHSCPATLHYHEKALEIHIVRRCKSKFLINQKNLLLHGHTALIIQPQWRHRNFHELTEWIHQVTLMLEPSIILKRHIRSGFSDLPESIQLTNFELGIIEIQCRLIKHEIYNPSIASLTIVRNEMENMFLLLQRAAKKNAPEAICDDRILKAIDIIEKNYANKLTIEKISTSVAMSPSHLSHLFKAQTGTSINRYILLCRMAAAKSFLESENCPKLACLAELVGFGDLSSFSRYFSRYVGVPPGAYRKISHK